MFPGSMNIGTFLMLNFVTVSVHAALGGVVFFFGVFFSDSSRTIGVASGLLVLFFILNMLFKLSDDIEVLKYFTPFSLINIDYILEGGGNGIWSGIVSLVAAIGIYIGAIIYFDKKDLII